MIKENDGVVLVKDFPDLKLRSGDIGTVVAISSDKKFYMVEFVLPGGDTFALEDFQASELRKRHKDELLAVRQVAAE